jgi:hypothetical protein
MTGMAGAVISLIGSGMDAYGTYSSAKSTKQASDYNATVLEQNAQATRISSSLREMGERKSMRELEGAQLSAFARSGVELTGSPLKAMFNSMANAEFDIAVNNYNAEISARGYESEATMRRYYGEQGMYSGMAKAGITMAKAGVEFALKNIKQPGAGTADTGISGYGTVLTAPAKYYKTKIGQ